MANTLDNLFQTLLAATSEASAVPEFANSFINNIFWGHKPIVGGTEAVTLNVIVPTVSEGNTVDIGSGPLQPHDTRHSSYPVTLDKHYSNSFVIKSFDQIRTPMDLRQTYVDAEVESLSRSINRTIANLFTAANFPNYAVIGGAGADKFDRADIVSGWKNLARAGIPLSGLNLVTSVDAYGNMMADSNFINESIVGLSAAEATQQRAKLKMLYGAGVGYDQHLEKFEAGKEPAALFHRYAVAGLRRTPASSDTPGVRESVVNIGPIPVQVQLGYSLKDQGWIVHYHCYWGVAPARRDYATLMQTA